MGNGVDPTNMSPLERVAEMLNRSGINNNGQADTVKLARAIFGDAGQALVNKAASLFSQAAMSDGNAELSAQEYVDFTNSAAFKELGDEYSAIMMNTYKRARNLEADYGMAKFGPHTPEEGEPASKEEYIKSEKGEYFYNEIWQPMQKLADAALDYMEGNSGSTEGFGFSGFPNGVHLISLRPLVHYTDLSNDIMKIVDGQPEVERHADFVATLALFEYQGETFQIQSERKSTAMEVWGNPKYIESQDNYSVPTPAAPDPPPEAAPTLSIDEIDE